MILRTFLDTLAPRYDRAHVRETIHRLPEQCAEAWGATRRIALPWSSRAVHRVVVTGMGGSGLGAHIIQAACADALRTPLTIVNDYTLPAFVDRRTLVLASSYSGATEETLHAYRHARALGASLAVLTTGGPLAAAARRDGVPAYIIAPTQNPSGQPRFAIGSSAFGILGLLRQARLLRMSTAGIDRAIAALRASIEHAERSSTLLDLARALVDRTAIIIAAEHLAGAAHAVQNMLHESAKHFAVMFLLPELHHHLLEGLRFPMSNPKALHAVLLASDRYYPRTQRRIVMTRDILRRQRILSTTITCTAPTPLGQALECVASGSLLAISLAFLHRIDPAPVPWVTELKRRLTRMR